MVWVLGLLSNAQVFAVQDLSVLRHSRCWWTRKSRNTSCKPKSVLVRYALLCQEAHLEGRDPWNSEGDMAALDVYLQ
jgi:hypothetical protein